MKIITNIYIAGTYDNGKPFFIADIIVVGVTSSCPLPHWHLVDTLVTEREESDCVEIANNCDDVKSIEEVA